MAIVISGNGIDMGNSPISNVDIQNDVDVVDKEYVDSNNTILQVVYAENKVVGSGSLTIPTDGTIPQITEGNEILTCTITPKKANSRLMIEFTPSCQALSDSGNLFTVACFRDGVNDALYQVATTVVMDGGHLTEATSTGRFIISTPTTNAITFSLRAGEKGGGIRWNQIKYASTETMNTSTTMTITEIAQ